jgi:hypothetical protein
MQLHVPPWRGFEQRAVYSLAPSSHEEDNSHKQRSEGHARANDDRNLVSREPARVPAIASWVVQVGLRSVVPIQQRRNKVRMCSSGIRRREKLHEWSSNVARTSVDEVAEVE